MMLGVDPVLFASVYGMIFLAELPDKTAFAMLLMATREKPSAVFVGAAGAFVVQSAVAVAFGGVLNLLPASWVKTGAGLLFLGFAWAMWTRVEEAGPPGADRPGASGFWRAAGAAFLVIFVAEWGDLTQLATAALVAERGRPLTIFLASTAALWSVTALAVLLGHSVKGRLRPERVQKVAAVVFALVGLYFLFK